MSSSRRRGGMDMNPKLHMDRQPTVTRITGKCMAKFGITPVYK